MYVAGTSVQSRLGELERELDAVKAHLSITRAKLRDTSPESIDVGEAQRLFQELARIFPDCNEGEKEELIDAVQN